MGFNPAFNGLNKANKNIILLKTDKRQYLHVLTGLIKFVVFDCIRLSIFLYDVPQWDEF